MATEYGDLRVWWVPQVPGKAFHVKVYNLEQAAMVLDLLADYDMFQYLVRVKPDYANAGGLEVFEKNSVPIGADDRYWRDGWTDWYDDDGDDFDEWMERQAELRELGEEAGV